MTSEYQWKSLRVLSLHLTAHEARALAAAIRSGQSKLADEIKSILKVAKP